MTTPSTRLDREELRSYWSNVSQQNGDRHDEGLSLVCYAGMPAWFNRFYDFFQRKAFAHLVQGQDFRGQRVLDMGTGVGRWARWYVRWPGTEVVGIDLEPLRLQTAREYGDSIHYLEMPVNELRFPDEHFDVINCVTVLQHVDDRTKRDALAEAARVLKPGGRLVIFELTDTRDDASHVFAWSDAQWRHEFQKNHLSIVRVVGDQYTPLLRLMKFGYKLMRRDQTRAEIDGMKAGNASPVVLQALRLGVLASYPIEALARHLPARFARINGYLLTKAESQSSADG